VVKGLPDGWEQDPVTVWMLDQATLGSKVAIMYATGKVTILHKNAGITEGGIWYSNDGFRPALADKDEWQAAAARWEAKQKAQKVADGVKVTPLSPVTSAFSKAGGLPIQSSALYRFEGITICGWCLARESNTDDAFLVDAPGEGEQCELCYHSPHVPGSRNLDAHRGVKSTALREEWDEGRVCTGA
jgi:hypothetical protein